MIWFTSDTHFGEEALIRNTRKEFGSVDEHDDTIIENINRLVRRLDRLYILGDFSEVPGRYRQRINCRQIFFILGNHDKPNKIRNVFGGNVWQQRLVTLTGGFDKVHVAHFPTAFWDKSHDGSYHAYGHIHNNREYEEMMDRGLPGRRSMDVGVDSAHALFGEYRPISEVEFLDVLSVRPGHDIIPPERKWTHKC